MTGHRQTTINTFILGILEFITQPDMHVFGPLISNHFSLISAINEGIWLYSYSIPSLPSSIFPVFRCVSSYVCPMGMRAPPLESFCAGGERSVRGRATGSTGHLSPHPCPPHCSGPTGRPLHDRGGVISSHLLGHEVPPSLSLHSHLHLLLMSLFSLCVWGGAITSTPMDNDDALCPQALPSSLGWESCLSSLHLTLEDALTYMIETQCALCGNDMWIDVPMEMGGGWDQCVINYFIKRWHKLKWINVTWIFISSSSVLKYTMSINRMLHLRSRQQCFCGGKVSNGPLICLYPSQTWCTAAHKWVPLSKHGADNTWHDVLWYSSEFLPVHARSLRLLKFTRKTNAFGSLQVFTIRLLAYTQSSLNRTCLASKCYCSPGNEWPGVRVTSVSSSYHQPGQISNNCTYLYYERGFQPTNRWSYNSKALADRCIIHVVIMKLFAKVIKHVENMSKLTSMVRKNGVYSSLMFLSVQTDIDDQIKADAHVDWWFCRLFPDRPDKHVAEKKKNT